MSANLITINKKTDKFFISINKSGAHSFIMLGIYDQYKVKHLLSRVGKVAVTDENSASFICVDESKFIAQAIFSTAKASLIDEGISRERLFLKKISYQAYDITYAQYLEFLRILEALQTPKNKFFSFVPDYEHGDQVFLTYRQVDHNVHKPNVDKIKKSVEGLNLGNTCRHTAIELVQEVQHAPISSSISSIFIQDLPCKTQLEYGKPAKSIPFYVLPMTPKTFSHLRGHKQWTLERLYELMERLVLQNQSSPKTQEKFACLKNFYNQLIESEQPVPLEHLLRSIQQWKERNKKALSTLRKTFFWDSFLDREAATLTAVNKMEIYLNNESNLSDGNKI